MTMPLGVALEMAKMVWIALSGWVCSCLTIADEVAASLRSGNRDMVGRTPHQWQVEHDPIAKVLILKLTLEIYLKADY
ncbi:hypothetical protein Gotri_016531 [Gossypium trilobum]|uniref:Secreted protein n=4 Tax=Gossypium TaxID=3633 RepID=A0A7J9BUZ1_GOSGO|nr:hypothetical protein [Gossypium davidsonii]MBA0650772.1 hypothetical protein [Gossypium klotzschianum]MBA0740010.1 hypothetical protein [Gossypium gossypioides]MBA0767670.1 hypothetical protein [Gossypium trilobum]